MNTSQIIAKNVRELCKKNNVSITKLLNDCGFSKNFINEMDKKLASPSIDKVLIIADYFDVTLDSLIDRQNNLDNNNLTGLSSYVLRYFNGLSDDEKIDMIKDLQNREILKYLKQEEISKINK